MMIITHRFLHLIVAVCTVLSYVQYTDGTDAGDKSILAEERRAFLRNPPVIDIAPLVEVSLFSDADRDVVQRNILDASHHWGFFQVLNHGISAELQQNLTHQMQMFFLVHPRR